MSLKRRFLFLALTVIGLVSLIPVFFAQTAETGEMDDVARNELGQNGVTPHVPPFGNVEGEPAGLIFHHWHGFALKGDQSYILRISIESVRPVEPINVRKLLASNKTIDEVGKEILSEEGKLTYRGHLKLGESTYWMTNVEVGLDQNNISLKAELNEPLGNPDSVNSAETAGRITVNTTGNEGELKGQGSLIITKGRLIGNYQVLLDMLH